MNRIPTYLIFPLLLSFLFLQENFHPIEFGVYSDYIQSIIQDFDLNIANQKLANIHRLEIPKIILTPTFYESDYHPYGMAFLYLPFALMGKLFNNEVFLSICTLFYALLGMYLLAENHKDQFSNKTIQLAVPVIFIGTPLFFYSVFYPSNANIAGFFISTLLYLHLQEQNFSSNRFYFIWGLLFSSLLSTRHEAIFYSILFLLPILNGIRIRSTYIIAAILGMLPIVSLYLANNYKQFGKIFLSQGGIDYQQFLLGDLLWSPIHGYLFTSPLLLSPFIYLIFSKLHHAPIPKQSLLVIIAIVVKVLCESFTNNSGENFGARAYLTDLPFLFPMILILIRGSTTYRIFAIATSFWCLSLIPSYLDNFRLMNLGTLFSDFYLTITGFKSLTYFFNRNIFLSGTILLSLIILAASVVALTRTMKKTPYCILFFFIICFTSVTFSNLNSHFSLSDYQEPKYILMGEGKELFHLQENLSNFRERKQFYLYRNLEKEALQVDRTRNQYLDIVKDQILFGDINSQ